MYKILIYFGSRQLNPLWLLLIIVSLLLLALAQSYASARKMRFTAALVLSLGFLVVGNAIAYFAFQAWFAKDYPPGYTFEHISIYSYGFMLMVSFVIGTIWLIVQGKREDPQVEADTILDLMVFIIVGSIIGARLIYVATQPGQYAGEHLKNVLKITEGGLSIHGGIMGALAFGWLYCRIKGLDYWRVVDFAIPGVPLGMFFGRIGCFLNGCCYGIKCYAVDNNPNFPFRNWFIFPNSETWQARDMPAWKAVLYDAGHAAIGLYARHPAQLYEAIGAILIFWYLINFRKHKAFKGHVFLMFVWLYSVLRFLVENFRFGNPDDPEPMKIGSSIVLWNFITVAQLASLILGIVALFLMQDLKRRAMLTRLLREGKAPAVKPKAEAEEEEEEEPEEEAVEAPAEEAAAEHVGEEGGEEAPEGEPDEDFAYDEEEDEEEDKDL